MLDQSRVGNFTSSQIWKLMTNGRGRDAWSKVALTYIEEVGMERELGRSLNSNETSRPTSWGSVIEGYVAGMLDNLEWSYQPDTTLTHKDISEWKGTPDLVGAGKVADIKCPYTLKSFVKLARICKSGNAEKLLDEFPEYYWQLVSNAILTGSHIAELIVFCPQERELDQIREYISNLDDTNLQTESQWIAFSSDDRLPWIPAESQLKSLNSLVFKVNEEDKEKLTNRVKKAILCLQKGTNA